MFVCVNSLFFSLLIYICLIVSVLNVRAFVCSLSNSSSLACVGLFSSGHKTELCVCCVSAACWLTLNSLCVFFFVGRHVFCMSRGLAFTQNSKRDIQ